MNSKELIKKNLGISLKEFAISNGFDLDTLNNLLSGKTKGDRKGTKAYKVKQFLISNNLFIEDKQKEKLEIDVSNIKNSLLKNFFLSCFDKKNMDDTKLKELTKYIHKKVPAILDLYFDSTVENYIKDIYFTKKNINNKDFSQFCFGTTSGSKKGSKAYYIRKKLIEDGVVPTII